MTISRREFARLSMGGAAAIAASHARTSSRERVRGRGIRLGGPILDEPEDPEAWAAAHVALGYGAAYCPVGPDAKPAAVRAYASAARKAGVVIAEVGVWNNPLSLDARERAAALAKCRSCLDLLRAVDRPRFAVHLDPVNLVTNPRLYFSNGELIREAFAKLGPHIRSCHAKDVVLREDIYTPHLSELRPSLTGISRVFLESSEDSPRNPWQHVPGDERPSRMATLRAHPPPKDAVGTESDGGAPHEFSWDLYKAYLRRWEAWGRQLGALLQERQALDLMARDLVAAAVSGGRRAEGGPASIPPLSELVESYERQLIRMALGACGGSQREAAAALGVLPTTLNEKLKRFGLRAAPRSAKH